MKKVLTCPAGIGDFSWVWSKLVHVKDEIEKISIVDGWPNRTTPYVELCGMKSDYVPIDYTAIQMNMALHKCQRWEEYRVHPVASMCTSANYHLELGHRLEEWLPDLPTDFHYPLFVKPETSKKAVSLLADLKHPIVGISCASYRGSEAWKTWGRAEWVDLLLRIQAEGWQPLLLGGFWDDLTYTVGCELDLPDLVGKTDVETAVAILDLLDGYIGFSSGLGVVRTVLDRSALMLWPAHQKELSDSWAPPDMLESRRYTAIQWNPVADVWPVVKRHLQIAPDRGTRKESTSWQAEAQA